MKQFFYLFLYKPLYNFLILIAWIMPGKSLGLAIILLTIIIRLILLPSSLKAARLQIKNLELQPKINKIRSEIKDPKEQSQALMQLYKDEDVSPFGSCLPLLIQLPILIVLYRVFQSGLTTNGFVDLYSFVSRPSTINTMFLGIDLAKPNAWALPIIAGVLQLKLSLMMMPPKPKTAAEANDPAAMMTKQMTYFLPLMTVMFGRAMPAALIIYWIITTIFSIFQQRYVNTQVKSEKLKVKSDSGDDQSEIKIDEPVKQTESNGPATKENMMIRVMNRRLEKQAKKAGVSVTVRTKKRG